MEEKKLKLAQEDIEEALKVVEDLEKVINKEPVSKEAIKESFLTLSEKVQKLEDILKSEGII